MASSLILSRKRLKVFRQNTSCSSSAAIATRDEEDRINQLHESILHNIFSFINIETQDDISSISCVCKRWNSLWKSLPCLHFTTPTGKTPDHPAFMLLVDRTLICSSQSNIHRFSVNSTELKPRYQLDSRRVTCWIMSAAYRNVQELSLDIPIGSQLDLPPTLFGKRTLLRVLELKGRKDHVRLKAYKNKFGLLKLTLVHLECLIFDGLWLLELLANAPLLETLVIKDCKIENLDKFYIFCAHLKKLELQNISPLFYGQHHPRVLASPVNICTQTLTSLTLGDYVRKEYSYSLKDLTSLIKADIGVKTKLCCSDHHLQRHTKRISELFYGLRNVEYLTVQPSLLAAVSEISYLLKSTLALPGDEGCFKLDNLRCLKLNTRFDTSCFHAMPYFLHKSPFIETLIVETTLESGKNIKLPDHNEEMLLKSDLELELQLEGTLQHLQTIEMKKFGGSDSELKFLKYLLKHAKILKKIRLVITKLNVKKTVNKKQLQSCLHASSHVSVSIFHRSKLVQTVVLQK